MAKLTEILSKTKTYFTGTVEELKEYKKDPVLGILFVGELAATIWGINDLESGQVNYIALPFAVDMVTRGAYSLIYYFSDRRKLKYNLSKDLSVEEANHPKVKEITNMIADKKQEGIFPPGLIGIIRQKGMYKSIIDDE